MSFAADHIGITSPADQLRRDLKRSLACGISQYHDVIFLVGKFPQNLLIPAIDDK